MLHESSTVRQEIQVEGRPLSSRTNCRSRSSTPRRLVTFVGENDSDILPFFLDHYRRLGVDEFHVTLHGSWSEPELEPLRADDVVITGVSQQRLTTQISGLRRLKSVARAFKGEWILITDADEFLELPYGSL